MKKILFVCTGNICRSPFAHFLFSKQAAAKGLKDLQVQSAGLLALPGNRATYLAQRVALEYDVDLTEHEAQLVTGDLSTWPDLILVMEKHHKDTYENQFPEAKDKILMLRHFARHGSQKRGIADPYGLEYEAYRFCFLDIQDSVAGLIDSFLSDKYKHL